MKKKILIIGNGANAYALIKKMSDQCEIYVTPASDAIKDIASVVDIRENNPEELLEFAVKNDIDMTIPLSEECIKSDIATLFSENHQPIFSPSFAASDAILNKTLIKKLLYKLRIPTPKFGIFEKENIALDYIKNQKIPFVIKTNDANSAVILTSVQTAKRIVPSVFVEKNKKLIVEDYIYGVPFTFYAVTDGYKALPFGSSLNFRYSLDGDGGQLTSGMGACAPNYKLAVADEYYLMDSVVYPLLEYLENQGNPYLGLLGVNGIKTEDGKIFVLGCNTFTQDVDTAAIFDNVSEDIFSLFESCIIGSFSDEVTNIEQKNQYSAAVVLTSAGKDKEKYTPISGIDDLNDETKICFYPAVRKNKYLEYEINSGAAVVLTSSAPTVSSAVKQLYEEAKCIDFKGIYYRKDICVLHDFS